MDKNERKLHSFRSRILAYIALPLILIMGLVYGFHGWINYQEYERDTYLRLEQQAVLSANHLNFVMDSIQNNTRGLSDYLTYVDSDDLYDDVHKIENLLINRLGRNPSIFGSAIAYRPNFLAEKLRYAPYVFRDGNEISMLDIGAEAYDYTDGSWSWWSDAIASTEGVWSTPYFDEGAGNILMITYSKAFGEIDDRIGVVTADIALDNLPRLMQIPSKNLVVLDKDDQVIFYDSENSDLKGSSDKWLSKSGVNNELRNLLENNLTGQTNAITESGHRFLVSVANVPVLGWQVVIATSDEELSQYFLTNISRLALILLLLSIALLLTSIIASKRLNRPLENLANGIIAFGEGKVNRLDTSGNNIFEVATLTNKFNQLAELLAERELALKDSTGSRFASLIDGMSDKSFYCSLDPQGQLAQVSDGVQKVLGVDVDTLKRKYQRMFTNDPINEQNWHYTEQALTGKTVPAHQVEMLADDGHIRRLDVFMQPLISDAGELISVEMLFTDVTEQFSAALWSNAVIESSPQAMLIVDELGNIIFTNSRCQELFGYSAEQILALNVELLFPERFRKKHEAVRTVFLEQELTRFATPKEGWVALKSDNTEMQVEINLALLPIRHEGRKQIAATIRDLTSQLAIERKIKDSESRFRGLVANIPGAIYRTRIEDHWIMEYVSDNIADMTGYSAIDLIESNKLRFNTLIHPDDDAACFTAISEAIKTQQSFDVEYRIYHRDGSIKWIHEKGKASYDEQDNPLWFDGSLHDVTDSKHALEAIKNSQKQLENITESLPNLVYQMIWHSDSEREFSFLSEACVSIIGFPRDMLMQNFDLLIDRIVDSQKQTILDDLAGKGVDGLQWVTEFQYLHPSGETIWLEAGAKGQSWNNDSIMWNGYLMNITDRKQAETRLADREKHLRALLNTAEMGIVNIDAYGVILNCNEHFGRNIGINSNALEGKLFFEFMAPEDKVLAKEQFKKLINNEFENFNIEPRILSQSGDVIWMDMTFAALNNDQGEVTSAVVSMADITSLMTVSNELKIAKDEADAASKAKSDFLANMSHEIRTPMNAIIGMSHLCLQTNLDKKQHNFVEKIERASKSLLGIINDILDFSKIEAGKMEIEIVPFQLDTLLEDLSDMFAVKAADKQLELLFSVAPNIPSHLMGDPLRLSQVLINLMNNAIKFTERGEVILTIETLVQQGDEIELKFSVRDSGIGLTPEQCNKLFQSFSQADSSTTRKYGGTGLGLAICKQLVELMDGQIGVESKRGVGSTFYFTAQLSQADDLQLKATQELEGMELLVVDDNQTARDILQTMLKGMGFSVSLAKDGTEAISMCHANNYKLALIDWKMPGMDGLETAETIMKESANPPLTIMVSAHATPEFTQSVNELGINGYITKPISASRLLDAIMSAFGKQGHMPVRAKATSLNAELLEQLNGKKVLLVEDNDMNQEVAAEFLQQVGIELTIADNGQIALDMVAKQDFDLVLMDCQMPVMDGYTATEQIRLQPEFENLPIIAMTANAMAGDKEKCINAGMNDHVAKPIEVSLLYQTLLKYLGSNIATENLTFTAKGSTKTDETWPQHPDVDVDRGLQLVQNSARLYRKILTRFVEGKRHIVKEITNAIDSNEREDAIRYAHTLKGLSGNLACDKLTAQAKELEKNLIDETELSDELSQLDSLVSSICEAIDVWLNNNETGDEATQLELISDEVFAELLDKLLDLLDDGDASATDMIDNLQLQVNQQTWAKLKPVGAMIKGYQFEDAVEHIEKIRKSIG
ncbi:PAS domain S-box protein [Shewanella sp. WPAGA9]|uniref:PAS domain S-box protein n=1 Tax=Shewanella sp. ENK2 TaxID=2775245 RepID=UPI00177BEB35|nr:PAS domain S-box protein [Shewanella sp. WPAGA9]